MHTPRFKEPFGTTEAVEDYLGYKVPSPLISETGLPIPMSQDKQVVSMVTSLFLSVGFWIGGLRWS